MKNIKKWRKDGAMSPAKQSMSTGQKQDGIISSKQTSMNQKKDTQSQTPSTLYRDIHEIPLINFARALCDKEYYYLYKEPSERNEGVEAAKMEQLINEYNQAMGGDYSALKRLKEIYLLLGNISILQASYSLIECGYQGEYIKALADIGVKLTGDKEKDLFKVKSTHSRLTREYKKLAEKVYKEKEINKEDNTPTIDSFNEILSVMGTHYKQIFPIAIPVGQFCSNYRRMVKEIQIMNSKSLNIKSNGSRRHR